MSDALPSPTVGSDRPITLRRMRPEEATVVAELIHVSTNAWYGSHYGTTIFPGDAPGGCGIFPETYEALDPGCCIVALDSGKIVGSCFFHPREMHVSVGIVNTHPDFGGRGIARRMIDAVIDEAGDRPVRLVSSLMNLDSYSLYTRAGFVPRQIFQDMVIPALPAGGLSPTGPEDTCVQPGDAADAVAIAAAEREIAGIIREGDWRYFLGDTTGVWHVSLLRDTSGEIAGALASSTHSASRIIGPGFARDEAGAAALLRAELNRRVPYDTPLLLIPASSPALIRQCYAWGARNVDLHVCQVRGLWTAPPGVVLPTFLPETG